MPRLVSLNNYYYRRGGSDVMFLEHDALFRRAGWDTAVFCMHHPRNLPTPWSQYFVQELEYGRPYGIAQKVAMAGKVVYSLEARQRLRRLLDVFRADVAHVHCIYHHISPSVLVELKRREIPRVLTAHDLKLACPAYKMLNAKGVCERCKDGQYLNVVRHRCVRDSRLASALVAFESFVHSAFGLWRDNLDRVIVPSRFFQRKLEEWGWRPELLAYIPNFINVKQYLPSYECGSYLLYAGRLAPEKGLITLVEAARRSGVDVVIAGDGPLERELLAQARGVKNVSFVGYQTGDRLTRLVQESRAVVLPSEWYENAPMSILEAYALGKPVLGANIGGIPELVIEGETGMLFTSADVDALTAAMKAVSGMSADSVRALGKRAREFVERHFNEDVYRDRMMSLYHGLGVCRQRDISTPVIG